MFVEPVVGHRQVASIPTTPVSALVAADKQDGLTPTIEREQHPYLCSPVEPGRNSFMFA
jgi:hypothetical protein